MAQIPDNKLNKLQRYYHLGDIVAFHLKGQVFLGTIKKKYFHSFLISFQSDDPEIVDKYHDVTIINNRKIRLVQRPKTQSSDLQDNPE